MRNFITNIIEDFNYSIRLILSKGWIVILKKLLGILSFTAITTLFAELGLKVELNQFDYVLLTSFVILFTAFWILSSDGRKKTIPTLILKKIAFESLGDIEGDLLSKHVKCLVAYLENDSPITLISNLEMRITEIFCKKSKETILPDYTLIKNDSINPKANKRIKLIDHFDLTSLAASSQQDYEQWRATPRADINLTYGTIRIGQHKLPGDDIYYVTFKYSSDKNPQKEFILKLWLERPDKSNLKFEEVSSITP